jgi:type III secretion protein L
VNLHWIDQGVLASGTAAVVKRADLEQVMTASQVLAEARAAQQEHQVELQNLRLQTEQQAYAEGLAAGKAAWALQLLQAQSARQEQLLELRPVLVELVMQALRHLLQELPDEERYAQLALPVLDAAIGARRARLAVAPGDEARARATLLRWQKKHGPLPAVELLVDELLAPGDCVLETEDGAVDGRLSERLAAIRKTLLRPRPEADTP